MLSLHDRLDPRHRFPAVVRHRMDALFSSGYRVRTRLLHHLDRLFPQKLRIPRTGTVDSAVTAFSRKRYSDPLDLFDCRCLPLCTDTYPAVVQKCRRGTDGKMIFT